MKIRIEDDCAPKEPIKFIFIKFEHVKRRLIPFRFCTIHYLVNFGNDRNFHCNSYCKHRAALERFGKRPILLPRLKNYRRQHFSKDVTSGGAAGTKYHPSVWTTPVLVFLVLHGQLS